MKLLVYLLCFFTSVLNADNFYYAFGKKVEVTKLSQSRGLDKSTITYYQTKNGHKVGVKHDVIIGCNKGDLCLKVLDSYDIKAIEKLSPTLYLLTLPEDSDPFTIANKLYQEKEIKLAHPNFIQKRILR